jgi:hypothetical protein
MKWLWIVPLICIGLVIVVAIIGMLLPKHHIATRRAAFKQSAAALWSLISDVDSFATWAPGVKSLEKLPPRDGQEAWKLIHNRGDSMSFALVERTPPSRFVTRIIDESAFGGTWTWVITPQGENAATVAITEDGDIHNPIFRFVARFILGYRGTMDAHLRPGNPARRIRPARIARGRVPVVDPYARSKSMISASFA